MTEHKKRLLVFVVAYNAERTIKSVLSRIPSSDLPGDTEVLVIDDSSADGTFEEAKDNRSAATGLKVTVLRTPENQGYGGNQKIGYQYAADNGFDVVALLHGDGQYAPEKLPDLVAPVLAGEADACFGSRIMEKGAALKNGMPFYKYIGNRILSVIQNRLLGMSLSEFHSGYRIYSVAALKSIPFRYNTNDFHFDTDIIIQFALKGLRIKELPIPTYYGEEICYVNGMAYAGNVMKSTLASRLHRIGLFYDRKFDVSCDEDVYDLKLGYVSSHTMALGAVDLDASVLDLACGDGSFAVELKKKGCRVTGVDLRQADEERFEKFIRHDLEDGIVPSGLGVFDYIMALDCLEHLGSPETLLAEIREKCYSKRCKLILTSPNIGFAVTRRGLLFGQFNYGKYGILDLTHRRLFTFKSFRRMLEQEGYKVIRMCGIPAPFVKAFGVNFLSRSLGWVNRMMTMVWPTMFAYQIYVEAEFQPPLGHLLSQTVATGKPLNPPAAGNR
ncbi:MAG: glycosyltransferase [Kiritimatiellae bacterium]|nr:glycosyltransferase [Kiritimatiellia bacterium]